MNSAKGDLELVAGRLVDTGGVLLGGIGEGIVVDDILDAGEVGIEGIDGGLGAAGGFDVGLGGYELRGVDVDGAEGCGDAEG